MTALPSNTALPLLLKQPACFARRYWPALLLLLCGAVADAITTYNNVARFGPATEMHLAHRYVFAIAGPAVGVPIAKLLQVLCVLLVAAWWRPWCSWLLGLCGILYAAAAVINHYLLL